MVIMQSESKTSCEQVGLKSLSMTVPTVDRWAALDGKSSTQEGQKQHTYHDYDILLWPLCIADADIIVFALWFLPSVFFFFLA